MHGWSRSLSCRIVEEKIKIDMLLFQLDVYNQCLWYSIPGSGWAGGDGEANWVDQTRNNHH